MVYEEGVDVSKFSDKQKAQIKLVEVVAAVTGVEIHLFESKLDQNGMYDTPYNGKFDRGSNTLWIDVNAGKLGENIGDFALTRTLSHELTHFIRMNAPQEYMALMRFCFQKIGADKFNELVEGKAAKNENLDFEDAIEEVIASGCEMVLRDSKAIEQLARENRSLAQKILDFLEGFAEKVKKAFEGVNAVSEEAKLLESHTAELVELWDNALKTAAKNSASVGDTAAMGDVSNQNSAAETQQKVSDSQDGAAESQQETSETEQEPETSKHKNIPDGAKPKGRDLSDYLDEDGMFEEREYNFKKEYERSVLGSFGIEKLNNSIHVTKRVLATLENEKFFTGESRKRIETNLESGMQIEINKSSIDETFSGSNYGRLGRFVKIAKLTTVRMLPEIIQRGILISDNVSDYHSNATNKKFAYFEYPVTIEGIPLNIKLSVKKSPQKNKLWVHSIYVRKNTDGFGGISSNEIKPPYRTIGTDEIISQDHTGVKEKPNKMYESRTAELTDEQVVKQLMANLTVSDPEYKILEKYNELADELTVSEKRLSKLFKKLRATRNQLENHVDTSSEDKVALQMYLENLEKEKREIQSAMKKARFEMEQLSKEAGVEKMIASERQELYKDSQIEKIIEAWS